MELKDYQKRAINKLDKVDALLLYHNMGAGKTLTAIEAAKQLGLPLEVIGPAALKGNFDKEQKKHNIALKKPIKYYSYQKPPAIGSDGADNAPTNSLLVFDEAHNMGRMESIRSHYPDVYHGRKTMFLTGTPIRNYPSELIPILRGLGLSVPRDVSKFNNMFIEHIRKDPSLGARLFLGIKPSDIEVPKNLSVLSRSLKGKVDYYNNEANSTDFPKIEEKTIPVEMSQKQFDTYIELMKGQPSLYYKVKHGLPPAKSESSSMNAFLNASRQISNTPRAFNVSANERDEPKLDAAVSEIKKRLSSDKNYKGITYSNYIASGINPMAHRLQSNNIPFAEFTGKTPIKDRKKAIEDYNEGRIKQLLISGAGSEGLDLRGTKVVQILEPHWNEPKIDQVIGRAARYQSHIGLPEGERIVEVQRFLAIPRKRRTISSLLTGKKKRDIGADEYLTMMSNNKEKLNQAFLNVLKDVGSVGDANTNTKTAQASMASAIAPIVTGAKSLGSIASMATESLVKFIKNRAHGRYGNKLFDASAKGLSTMTSSMPSPVIKTMPNDAVGNIVEQSAIRSNANKMI